MSNGSQIYNITWDTWQEGCFSQVNKNVLEGSVSFLRHLVWSATTPNSFKTDARRSLGLLTADDCPAKELDDAILLVDKLKSDKQLVLSLEYILICSFQFDSLIRCLTS